MASSSQLHTPFMPLQMLGEEDEAEDLSENYVMRIARWMVDATDQYDGDRFFTKVDDSVAYTYRPFHTTVSHRPFHTAGCRFYTVAASSPRWAANRARPRCWWS